MTLGDFRKLTKDVRDDVRLIVPGTHPNDVNEWFDIASLLEAPEWGCGPLKSSAVMLRTIRVEPRLANLTVLGQK